MTLYDNQISDSKLYDWFIINSTLLIYFVIYKNNKVAIDIKRSIAHNMRKPTTESPYQTLEYNIKGRRRKILSEHWT